MILSRSRLALYNASEHKKSSTREVDRCFQMRVYVSPPFQTPWPWSSECIVEEYLIDSFVGSTVRARPPHHRTLESCLWHGMDDFALQTATATG